ncbi:MAG: hypothetical protein WD397_07270 [Wenzhouxiangellaceae bacterium]
MPVITSQSVEKSGTGLDKFGKTPNVKGSNERRLPHFIKRLDSRIAHYINLTDASGVQNSHSRFAEPAEKNEKLKTFFRGAFTGELAEKSLRFRAEGNWYEVPR